MKRSLMAGTTKWNISMILGSTLNQKSSCMRSNLHVSDKAQGRPLITLSPEQNKRFHAMVRDIAKQVKWAGEYLDEEDWKRLILAGAYGQKVVPNPIRDGFIVMNNRRATGLEVEKTTDLITMLFAFGNENLVEWTDPTQPPIEIYEP